MFTALLTVELSLGLFGAMWVCQEVGRWLGRRAIQHGSVIDGGTGIVETSVLALLGLLLAFAFSGAESRLDRRRQQIIQEANSIGTAWLRLDLLPEADQPALRELMRRYLDARIAAFQKLPDLSAATSELNRANDLQSQIWTAAVQSSRRAAAPQVMQLVLPAMNDMIDMSTTRTVTAKAHVPTLVLALIFAAAMLSAVLAGYNGAARPRRVLQTLVFLATVSITVYVILDMEHPRVGLIRLSETEQALVELRQSMK